MSRAPEGEIVVTEEDICDAQVTVTEQIRRIAASKGMTLEYFLDHLKRRLEATERKPFNCGKSGIVYSDPQPVLSAQQTAFDQACRLLDLYPAERHHVETQITPKQTFDPLERAILDEVKKRMIDRIKKGE